MRVNGVPYVVNSVSHLVGYACELRGDIDQVKELTQEQGCRPGFAYKFVQEGQTFIATPKLTSATSYGCHNAGRDIGPGYEKKCSDGRSALQSCYPSTFVGRTTCTIEYCGGDLGCRYVGDVKSGENPDIEKARQSYTMSMLSEPNADKQHVLDQVGVPRAEQDTLLAAFNQQATAKNALDYYSTQRSEIAKKIADCGDFSLPVCTDMISKDAGLARQQLAVAEQVKGLEGNIQRLLAGEPPSSTGSSAETKPVASYVPPSSTGGFTGFDDEYFDTEASGADASGLQAALDSAAAQKAEELQSPADITPESGESESFSGIDWDTVAQGLLGAVPAAARVGGAAGVSSGWNPYIVGGGLAVGAICYYYCPDVVESVPDMFSPEAREGRTDAWTDTMKETGMQVLGGMYTAYTTVQDWWYGSEAVPKESDLTSPLESQNQAGFGEAISFTPSAYTPQGIANLLYRPLESQNQAGFGEALDFQPSAYTPQGIANLLYRPLESQSQAGFGEAISFTPSAYTPPSSATWQGLYQSTVGRIAKWGAGVIGITGVTAWWLIPPSSTPTPPPPVGGGVPPSGIPLPGPVPASEDKDKEKEPVPPAPTTPTAIDISKDQAPTPPPKTEPAPSVPTPQTPPARTPPPVIQQPPARPDTPIVFDQDYYCIRNLYPRVDIIPVPAGTSFPSNCINNPYQERMPVPATIEQRQPGIFNGLGQLLGRALGSLFGGSGSSQKGEEPSDERSSESSATPAAMIVGNPSTINSGETSTLSWASVFTRTCSVSSADGTVLVADGLSDGSVRAPALSTTTAFSVRCTTNATTTVSASTTVTVR